MATHRRPSFLKREKERKRVTRANDKREARRARKQARTDQADLLRSEAEEGTKALTPDGPLTNGAADADDVDAEGDVAADEDREDDGAGPGA
jgi:hypothetical protein